MKNHCTIRRFIRAALLGVAGLLAASCAQNTDQPGKANATARWSPPQVTILANLPDSSQPRVTLLAEKPQLTITLNAKPATTRSFIDTLTQLPLAPEVQGTGFFTRYTTDDGLSSDMIACSTMDREGAIWFGSFGGGVSRYDGKKFTTYAVA